MKKIIAAIIVILAGYTTVTQATLKNNTWYAGGKVSWSQFFNTNWYNSSLANNGSTHKNQLGMSAFGGYQVNPYIGIEMGYDWMGRMPYKGNKINGAFKAQGIQMSVKAGYPLIDYIDIYTRLGGIMWHADSSNSIVGENHAIGLSPVFAGGIEWKIKSNIATRLEYQWANNISNGSTVGVSPDNGMLGLGIFYRFGQQTTNLGNIRNTSTVSILNPEVQAKRFTLKSSVLFDFNQTTLKSEGQQILDQLYDQLGNLNSKNDSIVVMGFTDRIGSNTYNRSLSEKRAQSVVNYLLSKGISGDKVSARGMGESNSISSSTCNKIKNLTKMIDCLASDRRVEIEVKGTKNVTSIQPTVPAV